MQKLGLFLHDLGHSQIAYEAITAVNKYYDGLGQADITLFTEVPTIPIIQPKTAIMFPLEIYEYDGTIVATNLNQIQTITKFLGPKKVFYAWELEWAQMGHKQYEQLASLYRDKNFTVITRSEEYKKQLEKSWNIKVKAVIEHFNIEELLSL